MSTLSDNQNILIIKLGALGDFIQALGPMKSIRDHHPGTHITLLTTHPYDQLALASGSVDAIWIDDRPRLYQVTKWLTLRSRLRLGQFARVYDLQTSERSSSYFRLFPNSAKPEWSGIAKGCSHPHNNPNRDFMHTQDRQREQLKMSGIYLVPPTDLSQMNADVSHFNLPKPYGLLVPGGAVHRPAKRWPVDRYAELSAQIKLKGITPVILGSSSENDLAEHIKAIAPDAIDLTGQTSLIEIIGLAKNAKIAVGNDTGPMHMASAAHCPSVVLFSNESDPKLCAPKGQKTAIFTHADLNDLSAQDVLNSAPFEAIL
jgi:ADP-heptose:LPS heptosyltransferase